MPNPLLKVKIITPKETIFEGSAYAVSSVNSEGRFDILPEHANFITLVEKQPIEIRDAKGQVKMFNFGQAIIYSSADAVSVFAEPVYESIKEGQKTS